MRERESLINPVCTQYRHRGCPAAPSIQCLISKYYCPPIRTRDFEEMLDSGTRAEEVEESHRTLLHQVFRNAQRTTEGCCALACYSASSLIHPRAICARRASLTVAGLSPIHRHSRQCPINTLIGHYTLPQTCGVKLKKQKACHPRYM